MTVKQSLQKIDDGITFLENKLNIERESDLDISSDLFENEKDLLIYKGITKKSIIIRIFYKGKKIRLMFPKNFITKSLLISYKNRIKINY